MLAGDVIPGLPRNSYEGVVRLARNSPAKYVEVSWMAAYAFCCDVCGVFLKDRDTHHCSMRLLAHEGNFFSLAPCEHCGEPLRDLTHRAAHLRDECHPFLPKDAFCGRPCPHCPARFTFESALKRHLHIVHKETTTRKPLVEPTRTQKRKREEEEEEEEVKKTPAKRAKPAPKAGSSTKPEEEKKVVKKAAKPAPKPATTENAKAATKAVVKKPSKKSATKPAPKPAKNEEKEDAKPATNAAVKKPSTKTANKPAPKPAMGKTAPNKATFWTPPPKPKEKGDAKATKPEGPFARRPGGLTPGSLLPAGKKPSPNAHDAPLSIASQEGGSDWEAL